MLGEGREDGANPCSVLIVPFTRLSIAPSMMPFT